MNIYDLNGSEACKPLFYRISVALSISQVDKLEQMIQILHCVEVFVELSARRIGGNSFRWLVVSIISVAKMAIRLCLIYQHDHVLIGSFNITNDPKGWMGQRSGVFFTQTHPNSKMSHHIPNKELIVAELCYTLRPIVHLASLGLCKSKSWVPFLLAIGLDIYSLRGLGYLRHPTDRQANELSRRKFESLLYLFRSPLYDEITEHRLVSAVNFVSNIPVLGLFTDGIMDYLPDWQKIYFAVWGS